MQEDDAPILEQGYAYIRTALRLLGIVMILGLVGGGEDSSSSPPHRRVHH